MKKTLLTLLLILSALSALAANPPPEPGVTPVPARADAIEPYKGVTVELYGTTWCGYCKKARVFLKSRNIAYTDYDVEKNPDVYKHFRQISSSGGVPVLVIGKYVIGGYQEEAYLKALEASRPPAGPFKN